MCHAKALRYPPHPNQPLDHLDHLGGHPAQGFIAVSGSRSTALYVPCQCSQVSSPSKPASVPPGLPGTPPRASLIVPKLPLGALASHQQQQPQQQQHAQEPQPHGGRMLDEGLLPWGSADPGLRPQSRMAEDLVVESARGKDKSGVSRSNTYEILENLPQPQRVLTSQQQQRQQQDFNGKGSGADSGTGSVLGWGFQLPMDGEESHEHNLSPFQAPHPQSAPSHSSSHNGSHSNSKHSGTATTPAMPTVVESPAVSGALPGGVSLGSSARLHSNSGRVDNSSSQLLTVGGHGVSNLGDAEHGGTNLNSPSAAQPNSRASSAAQLRLAGPAALPRPSSIARHTPPPASQGPPIPPSSRYATPPPATAPVPTRSSAARLTSPLLPPEHPQNGAAGLGGPTVPPNTAERPVHVWFGCQRRQRMECCRQVDFLRAHCILCCWCSLARNAAVCWASLGVSAGVKVTGVLVTWHAWLALVYWSLGMLGFIECIGWCTGDMVISVNLQASAWRLVQNSMPVSWGGEWGDKWTSELDGTLQEDEFTVLAMQSTGTDLGFSADW
ncbi:hypothetical protein DUNSADRAFT_17569 [Dunaliella salina]|uniref:Uncharacterized protein n=1 Tax=Dunaliella salina TaxID=3046 RepID=A0ABQ7G1J6_DUNSA|nr:hypothetical protein DUNSADRAFT_17569 [Dunaliella salina]|eukprot:KAF5828479.1 hypothetical protein DUNSADRAFT_17569 [Dunaliella salina]